LELKGRIRNWSQNRNSKWKRNINKYRNSESNWDRNGTESGTLAGTETGTIGQDQGQEQEEPGTVLLPGTWGRNRNKDINKFWRHNSG
jgi:hypothetical protein